MLCDYLRAIKPAMLGIQTAQGKHSPDDYFAVLNSLFRPLLLDGITMLELAGKTALAQEFTAAAVSALSARVKGRTVMQDAFFGSIT